MHVRIWKDILMIVIAKYWFSNYFVSTQWSTQWLSWASLAIISYGHRQHSANAFHTTEPAKAFLYPSSMYRKFPKIRHFQANILPPSLTSNFLYTVFKHMIRSSARNSILKIYQCKQPLVNFQLIHTRNEVSQLSQSVYFVTTRAKELSHTFEEFSLLQWAFGLASLSSVLVNTCTQNHNSLIHWLPPRLAIQGYMG